MTDTLHRTADVIGTGDGRTLIVRLCRWLDPRPVRDRAPGLGPAGMTAYREQWGVDSLIPDERIQLVDSHNGNLIGSADPATLRSTPEGPEIECRVADSALGDHQLALVREGHVTAVSMEAAPDTSRDRIDGDLVTRGRALLRGIALTFRPAHDAPILATRSHPTTAQEGTPMTEIQTPTDSGTLTQTLELPADVVRAEQMDELQRAFEERMTALDEKMTGKSDPLARFSGLGDFTHHLLRCNFEEQLELQREMADAIHHEVWRATQTKTNNPGVDRPQWLTAIAGSFARSRPAANAFGIIGKRPGEGGTFSWPQFTGDITTLVGNQAAEGDAVTSVAVNITAGTATAGTWAGGSTISYQLVRNSVPSYLDGYRQLMSQGYAVHSESQVGAQIATAAVDSATAVWDPASDTTEALIQALVIAGIEVEAATGAPGAFALAATDIITAAAGKDGFVMGAFGAASGNAATGAGLQIPRLIHAPFLPAGELIVSNTEAGNVFEDGPMVATVEQALTLGTDWAIWGQGVFGARIANGIRAIPAI